MSNENWIALRQKNLQSSWGTSATNDIVYDIKTTILEFYGKKRATFTLNFMGLQGSNGEEKNSRE